MLHCPASEIGTLRLALALFFARPIGQAKLDYKFECSSEVSWVLQWYYFSLLNFQERNISICVRTQMGEVINLNIVVRLVVACEGFCPKSCYEFVAKWHVRSWQRA